MAIRIVRGYRTISFEAATVLARFPPLDILAEDARVYDQVRTLRRDGGGEPDRVLEAVRRQERHGALASWRAKLSEEHYARKRVVGAILPVFEAWMQRRDGRLIYRLTQVITGHGCFGDYLCRIGREATAYCFHCGGAS
ncbi:uncharacterized protein [Battus philenor]|uniref:uncharacterized protein n=1 Tax=Battus philenor TaxID=42288 RepID=UPI0035CFC909